MKRIILIAGIFSIFSLGIGQNHSGKLGFSLRYSSIRQIIFTPAPATSYKLFKVISPGLRFEYNKHKIGVNYDFIASLNYSPFAGFAKRNPKGVSGLYSYSFINHKWL